MPEHTALGALLERARASLRISQREAARRAGISPSKWRQVLAGEQWSRGRAAPATPNTRTVVAMALAVALDPADALTAAGLSVPADLAALVEDVREEMRARQTSAPKAGPVRDLTPDEHRRLAGQIDDIERTELPEAAKMMMLDALIRAWGRYGAERAARRDEPA